MNLVPKKPVNQNFQIFFKNPHLLEICSIGTNLQVFWAVPNLIFHQVTLLQSKASRKMLHKKGFLPSQDAVPQVIFNCFLSAISLPLALLRI